MGHDFHDQRESMLDAGWFNPEPPGNLHRPLPQDDGVFKGGLSVPAASPVAPPSAYGWICPKCGSGNAPKNTLCACCSRAQTP